MGAKGHHQDHYEVLGVPPEAGDQAIRDAYRWLARKFHPDQNVDGDGRADTMMKRVNVAYGVLGDPIKRRAYDRLRGAGEEAPPPAPPHEAPKAGAPQPEAERVADVEDVEDVEHEDSRIRTCGNCGAIVALDATRCAKCWAKLGANEPSRTQSRTSADGPRRKAPSRVARGPRRKAPNGLRRVLKIIAWLVAVVLFGVGAVVVYAVFDDHERTAEREAVKLSAEYDPNRCSTDHPILVTIANGSMRTVREVRFELEAYEEGRSDNLFGYNGQRTWTAVIPPGNTSPSCWSAPSFSRDVTGGVTVRAKIGWVELYARNEFIPPGPAPVPSAPAPVSPAPMETGRKGGNGGGAQLSADETQHVVSAHSLDVKRGCWDRSSSTTSDVTETVHIVIAGSGQVTSVSATGNDAIVGHCLEEEVKRWKWPGGGEVNIPFHFVRQ